MGHSLPDYREWLRQQERAEQERVQRQQEVVIQARTLHEVLLQHEALLEERKTLLDEAMARGDTVIHSLNETSQQVKVATEAAEQARGAAEVLQSEVKERGASLQHAAKTVAGMRQDVEEAQQVHHELMDALALARQDLIAEIDAARHDVQTLVHAVQTARTEVQSLHAAVVKEKSRGKQTV